MLHNTSVKLIHLLGFGVSVTSDHIVPTIFPSIDHQSRLSAYSWFQSVLRWVDLPVFSKTFLCPIRLFDLHIHASGPKLHRTIQFTHWKGQSTFGQEFRLHRLRWFFRSCNIFYGLFASHLGVSFVYVFTDPASCPHLQRYVISARQSFRIWYILVVVGHICPLFACVLLLCF